MERLPLGDTLQKAKTSVPRSDFVLHFFQNHHYSGNLPSPVLHMFVFGGVCHQKLTDLRKMTCFCWWFTPGWIDGFGWPRSDPR